MINFGYRQICRIAVSTPQIWGQICGKTLTPQMDSTKFVGFFCGFRDSTIPIHTITSDTCNKLYPQWYHNNPSRISRLCWQNLIMIHSAWKTSRKTYECDASPQWHNWNWQTDVVSISVCHAPVTHAIDFIINYDLRRMITNYTTNYNELSI